MRVIPRTTRGYDAGKREIGRKQHIAVDTDGRLLLVNLTSADISDSAGAQVILAAIRKRWPWLKHPVADGVHDRGKLMSKAAFLDVVVEIVRRIDHELGCKVLPKVGGRAHLRLDGPLALGTQLRGRARRFRGDPPSNWWTPLIRSKGARKAFDGDEDATGAHPRIQAGGGGPAGEQRTAALLSVQPDHSPECSEYAIHYGVRRIAQLQDSHVEADLL